MRRKEKSVQDKSYRIPILKNESHFFCGKNLSCVSSAGARWPSFANPEANSILQKLSTVIVNVEALHHIQELII